MLKSSKKVPGLLFKEAAKDCFACHSTPHKGQFQVENDPEPCEGCHGADSFQPAVFFDHDKDSRFSLKGAHTEVPCISCHPTAKDQHGEEFVVYKTLASECQSCH